ATDGFGGLGFGELLSDFDGHITEYRAGIGTLNALYADIPYDEGFERVSQRRHEQRGKQARHQALFVMKHPRKHVLGYPRSSKWRKILCNGLSGKQTSEIVE